MMTLQGTLIKQQKKNLKVDVTLILTPNTIAGFTINCMFR